MDKQQLHNLKNQVIAAFVAHELGNELIMSDKVYDEKLAKILEEDPKFNIYEFKPVYEDSEYVPHRSGIPELEKEKIHDIEEVWNNPEPEYNRLPKWDGSSLVIYYTNGKFTRIVSMGDKGTGIDQTEKFESFVPKTLDPSISFLRCECLIDMRLTDNARGKANGLVNSKYLQDEIEELATLMCFAAHDLEGKKVNYLTLRLMLKNCTLVRENGIPKFLASPKIEELTYKHGVALFSNPKMNFQFAIDGIVYYDEDYAYKYDYINSAITTVTSINWSETDREGFFATVSVEPVEVDGATVRNPSSNGTNNLINLGIGVGARVEVIRSGVTIPKIINVVTPVEFEYPKCPHCDYQMSADDLYGSTLKCGNPDCPRKLEIRRTSVEDYIKNAGEEESNKYFRENIEDCLFWLLNVSRFDYSTHRLKDAKEIEDALHLFASNDATYEEVLEYIGNAYSWTDLQWSEAELYIKATWIVVKEIYNK